MRKSSNMPELLRDVSGQLASVEEGLAALDQHKRELHQHADSVKQEISSAVEFHMAALRAREKQLIRQVELVSTHQSCRLNVTQAQLLQHQGALAVTRSILHRCASGNEVLNSTSGPDNGACSKRNELCCLSTKSCGKETGGEISLPHGASGSDGVCVNMTGDRAHISICNSFEKTGDVVKRDLDGLNEPPSAVNNGSTHRNVNGLLQQAQKLLRVPFISVTSLEDPALTSAIQNLGNVTLPPTSSNGELVPHCEILPHCELLPHSELLPHCLEEYGDADHHVLHKSVRPDCAVATIDVRRPYLLAARARHSAKKIEALASEDPDKMPGDTKEDLVRWLHRMQLDTPVRRPQPPAKECDGVCVEEACQGNETCSSFSECFMNGQCKKNALEKTDQTNKWRLQQKPLQQLQLSDQDFLLRNLNKGPPAEQTTYAQTQLGNSKTFLMPSNLARKRLHSSPNSAIQPVIAHMDAIQRSSNGSWLLIKGTNGIAASLANIDLNSTSCGIENFEASAEDINKKMRANAESGEMKSLAFRAAILYQAPSAQWRLSSSEDKEQKNACNSGKKLPESDDVEKDSSNVKNDWLLKKAGLTSPKRSVLEKLAAENENSNMFLADRIKSQLSLASLASIENLKEKIDRLSAEAGKSAEVGDADSWLLQQSPAQRADNQILEEIMEKKSEWLSTSSQSSFSVISESESRGTGWLMP
ncbi:uncharacterized protein LOC108675379 [Hyalella azteca]|uniref:Uncharacterized protein LOC108675379 n=1 Tax=Hyalella azteca TaxID=294128 RepID=A0A8B7NYM3_HYAAZ|nr:uncharacterized protein LOC108675379 [Hyalella azteca]XP_018018873.1 uncharacterized protein LOC108675379 [Hyalella azteca]